jgi:hypothetical protein
LENVRRKGASLRVELNFDVPGVGEPFDLLSGIEHDHFGKHSYHH